jgi:hypothetical protein
MFLNQHIAELHAAELRAAAVGGRRLRSYSPRASRTRKRAVPPALGLDVRVPS